MTKICHKKRRIFVASPVNLAAMLLPPAQKAAFLAPEDQAASGNQTGTEFAYIILVELMCMYYTDTNACYRKEKRL